MLISHILKRFDLIAVQEVNDNFKTFAQVVKKMGPGWCQEPDPFPVVVASRPPNPWEGYNYKSAL